jgi:hypothetical protein
LVAILKNCLEHPFQGFACKIRPIQANFHSIHVRMTCAGQKGCPPLIYTYLACSPPTNLWSPNCAVTPWKYYSLSRMACANKSRYKAPVIPALPRWPPVSPTPLRFFFGQENLQGCVIREVVQLYSEVNSLIVWLRCSSPRRFRWSDLMKFMHENRRTTAISC